MAERKVPVTGSTFRLTKLSTCRPLFSTFQQMLPVSVWLPMSLPNGSTMNLSQKVAWWEALLCCPMERSSLSMVLTREPLVMETMYVLIQFLYRVLRLIIHISCRLGLRVTPTQPLLFWHHWCMIRMHRLDLGSPERDSPLLPFLDYITLVPLSCPMVVFLSLVLTLTQTLLVSLHCTSFFISVAWNTEPISILVTDTWSTEYRVERFYPAYYSERRPEPVGLPAKLGYGGSYFNLTLASADLGSDAAKSLQNTKVVVMRFGFSTHAIVSFFLPHCHLRTQPDAFAY